MLELKPIEFFLRVLPESFLFIFGIYLFSNVKIDIKKYIISGIIYAVIGYIVRMLPLTYGIHTIILIGIAIIICNTFNKIDLVNVIKATIIMFIIQFIVEGFNLFFLQSILKLDLEYIFRDPLQKTMYGIPALIIVGVILIKCYNWKCRGKNNHE